MDLNIVNNQEKFLAGKLEGYTLRAQKINLMIEEILYHFQAAQ